MKPSELTRGAFRRALGDADPDVGRIAGAVPGMIAEARRRRAQAERAGILGLVAPLARQALPRLAVAAAILILAATWVGTRDRTESSDDTAGLDRLMLTGEVNGQNSDILLRALTEGGQNHG